MSINKISQLVATIVEYPYMDKMYPTSTGIPLVITEAYYYDPADIKSGVDVESYLSALLINNKLSFIVENETFGGNRNDPAPGVVKELKLSYLYNGITSTMICKEKSTVTLQAY